MSRELSDSAKKVQDALAALGLPLQVVELPGSTRTAQEAASAIGCEVAQIVKSILFRGKNTGQAILVLASGINRINEKRLGDLVGEPVEKADADFVRQQTGFAIGGVPPLALNRPLRAFIDQDLFNYPEIWAAAGTPHAVFCLKSGDLERITGGIVIKVA